MLGKYLMLCTCCVFAGISGKSDEKNFIDDYRLIRVVSPNNETIRSDLLDAIKNEPTWRIWNLPKRQTDPIDLLVHVKEKNDAMEKLRAIDMLIEPKTIPIKYDFLPTKNKDKIRNVHQQFHNFHDMQVLFKKLEIHYPWVTIETLGITARNYPITLIKMVKNKTEAKAKALIVGGLEGRDWVSSSSILYFIDFLIGTHKTNILGKFEWYFIPIANPDGYIIGKHYDRIWQKNLRDLDFEECIGVNINRNFPTAWNESSYLYEPCHEEYPGDEPASEIETKVLIDLMHKLDRTGNLSMFFSVESYGNMILTGYSYAEDTYPEKYELLMDLCDGVTDRLIEAGKYYHCGTSGNLRELATGTIGDYAASVLNKTYAYTVKLADEGYSFFVPATSIVEIGEHLTFIIYRAAKFVESIL